MTERKVTGVLQSDWSAAIQDYPIASGWTHDGGALVVCDSAGGVYELTPGRYQLDLAEGPDPAISLVVRSGQGLDDAGLREGA